MKSRITELKQLLINNKFMFMMIMFLTWFASGPLVINHNWAIECYVLTYLLLMICGAYMLTRSRVLLMFTLVLSISAFYEWVTHLQSPTLGIMKLFGSTVLLFDFIITFAMILRTIIEKETTRDLLFGVILTFFMIGESFGDAYYVMQYWDLVKFTPLEPGMNHTPILDCVYFSFTTLTTTGFGDIVPATHFTKRMSSIEQCIGVLYVAVFIGRMMNTYNNHHQNKRNME